MEKGDIAHFEQFQLLPRCFPKTFFLQCVRMSIHGGKGLIMSKAGPRTSRKSEKKLPMV